MAEGFKPRRMQALAELTFLFFTFSVLTVSTVSYLERYNRITSTDRNIAFLVNCNQKAALQKLLHRVVS